MYLKLITDPKFFLILTILDNQLAEEAHSQPCPFCNGKLDWGNYMRKPRGAVLVRDPCCIRFSLCCRQCRKRLTPPSLRFLSRKVYYSAVICLITTMMHGATRERCSELRALIGANWKTVARWREFWHSYVPSTPYWQGVLGYFNRPISTAGLPGTLLERFVTGNNYLASVKKFLQFISPLSVGHPAAVIDG